MVTHSELLKLVHYDPKTGIFLLKESTTRRLAGSVMNCNWLGQNRPDAPRNIRRTTVNIRRTCYPAGRLAWFYMTGKWPVGEVIHMDHDGWNLSFDNLRDASHAQAKARARRPARNKTGRKGVLVSKGKFEASVAGISVGYFKTKDEAAEAYARKARELYGEFAYPD